MRIRVSRYGLVFLFTLLLMHYSAETMCKEGDPTAKRLPAGEDTQIKDFWDNKSLGINVGSVYTKDYDTGFGFGAHFNQTFYHPFLPRPFLKSSPTVQFWGASNDSTDVAVVGIMECVNHLAPFAEHFTGFAGLNFGYYHIYKKTMSYSSGDFEIGKEHIDTFEIFITVGLEYELPEFRSLFFQIKYGKIKYGGTDIKEELHAMLGFNFRPARKK